MSTLKAVKVANKIVHKIAENKYTFEHCKEMVCKEALKQKYTIEDSEEIVYEAIKLTGSYPKHQDCIIAFSWFLSEDELEELDDFEFTRTDLNYFITYCRYKKINRCKGCIWCEYTHEKDYEYDELE